MPRMLDLREGEQLEPVATAIAAITGQRPHPSTVTRWIRDGAAGVVLPTLLVGTRRMTTQRAVREWIAERTAAASA